MEKIQEALKNIHNLINELGPSRELALAKTKIEEAGMWVQQHLHLTKKVSSGQDASHPKEH
jgi:hypothetical protein